MGVVVNLSFFNFSVRLKINHRATAFICDRATAYICDRAGQAVGTPQRLFSWSRGPFHSTWERKASLPLSLCDQGEGRAQSEAEDMLEAAGLTPLATVPSWTWDCMPARPSPLGWRSR